MLQNILDILGDIRRALNFMHFTLSTFSSSAAKTDLQNLDHFHFLGKIMYSKRADRSTAEWDRCEKKLSKRANQKFGRPFPPKDDVNALILRSYYLAGSSVSFRNIEMFRYVFFKLFFTLAARICLRT